MLKSTLASLALVAALTGCGLIGAVMSMRDTDTPATSDNFDLMADEAKKIGWTAKRGNFSTTEDWPLQVFPAEGQKIIFTKNQQTNWIAFTCKGGPLDDKPACLAAANRLFKASFNREYVDD